MSELQFMFWATLRAVDAGFQDEPRFTREGDCMVAKVGNLTMRAKYMKGILESASASTPGFSSREFNLSECLEHALSGAVA